MNIIFFILGILGIIIALYLIEVLRRLRAILISTNNLINEVKDRINPTILDINLSIKEMKDLTRNIDSKLDKTESLFEVVQNITEALKLPSSIAGQVVEASTVNLTSLAVGLKEGIKEVLGISSSHPEKEEKNN